MTAPKAKRCPPLRPGQAGRSVLPAPPRPAAVALLPALHPGRLARGPQRRRQDPAAAEQLRAVDRAASAATAPWAARARAVVMPMSLACHHRGPPAARGLGGRAGAAATVPFPFLVLDLGRGCDPRTRRAVAAAAGAAGGGRPPPRPRLSMPATRRPPTAGPPARPGVATCGCWPGGGRGEAGAARLGLQPPPHLYPRRRPELGGVAVLVVVTVLATLAAPHARHGSWAGRWRAGGAAGHRPPWPLPPAGDRPGQLGRWPSPLASGASRTAGAPKAPRLRLLGADLGGLASRRGGHPPDRGRPARRPPPRPGRLQPGDLLIYPSRWPVAAACGDGRRPGPDGRGPGPRHPGPLDQHPRRLAGGRPTRGRPMTAAFLDFLGWEQLTAAEQAAALGGACLGLAAWLLARALFGGRRRR